MKTDLESSVSITIVGRLYLAALNMHPTTESGIAVIGSFSTQIGLLLDEVYMQLDEEMIPDAMRLENEL